jgi:hypothetical protein
MIKKENNMICFEKHDETLFELDDEILSDDEHDFDDLKIYSDECDEIKDLELDDLSLILKIYSDDECDEIKDQITDKKKLLKKKKLLILKKPMKYQFLI